jgi:protoporphyrinogen oxidase
MPGTENKTGAENKTPVVVLGAGPAGLGAALKLARRGEFQVTVVERGKNFGGNAGSFDLAGLRVDFGSHRLHPSCAAEILADIRQMLGEDLLDRPRHGRIRLRGRWVHFPLKPADLLTHLPPKFAFGVACDTVSRFGRPPAEETFATVLERGLGRTICRDFYFPYARKIWGAPPAELDAEQARRRVSAGSLGKMIRKVLNGVAGQKGSGKGRFFYPKKGFGAISEAYGCAAARAGATMMLGSTVSGIEVENGRAVAVRIENEQGEDRLPARQILSTIPLSVLVKQMIPAAPAEVLAAAGALRFRAMILIYLVLETDRFTEYDAHYFPDAEIGITRLSEPKNYGLAALPGRTVLCAELPCAVDDPVWRASDTELRDLVLGALSTAGIPVAAAVCEVASRRLPNAYPIYTRDYRGHFERIDHYLNSIDGLLTFGRQGLFAHDNTHHALAMAYAMDECLNSAGDLDRNRWEHYRREFQKHVVED